jgi:hypothetical protein
MIDILTQVFPMAIAILAGAIGYGKLLQNVKALEKDILEIRTENKRLEKEMDEKVCNITRGLKGPDGRSVFVPRAEFWDYRKGLEKKIEQICSILNQIRGEQAKHGEVLASLKTYLDMKGEDR